jgi:signal transduction histidine kinase
MQEAVSSMIRSNQNLLTMVNLLLEVYRYEAGRKTLTFAPVDLTELVTEVVSELQPIAQDKSLLLQTDLSSLNHQSVSRVMGDRLELRRVITNLLGNAIKFTDAGAVTIRLQPGPTPTAPMLLLSVADTGPGIPESQLPNLFESFSPGSHRRSGSGLGLHLSRRIVEAHQGRIAVQSTVGKGSVFTVEFPIAPEAVPTPTNSAQN